MLALSAITIHPDLITAYRNFGVMWAAESKGLARVQAVNLRDYGLDRHGSVDDRPYGGGEGMVLRPEPLAQAIQGLAERPYVILTSPAGVTWTQAHAQHYAASSRPLCFICGRFGGVDQRFIDRYVDAEYSMGDFVMAGGELAALAMMDSLLRLIPGVLGDDASAHFDSFATGMEGLLEYPLYTRPPVFEGVPVPPVLTSGDHKRINAWRREQMLAKTAARRPDLLPATLGPLKPSLKS